MTFVDTNVFIYAVGRSHPLREDAQRFFIDARQSGLQLVTSAEVLQELLHGYLAVARYDTLDAALHLATTGVDTMLPVDAEAVFLARHLADHHRNLTARDLLHLAVCRLNHIKQVKTYDRALQSVFQKR